MINNTVSIKINGEEKPLHLTLGALAEIEDGLGGDIDGLKTRLATPRIGDLLIILNALLRGGGASLSLEALKAADVDLAAAANAIANAFQALEAPGKPQPEDQPPDQPQDQPPASSGAA